MVTYEMLKLAFGQETRRIPHTTDRSYKFSTEVTSVNNAKYSGYIATSETNKNVRHFHENRCTANGLLVS
jgi:hypothetical protein